MAPPRKNPARRQRRNKKPDLRLTRSNARASVPTPPRGLLVATCKKWDEYWRSDVSNVVQTAHIPALERMFMLIDELERATRAVRKRGGRMTTGSKGQLVQSPLLKYMDACLKEVSALEDRFGLTPGAMQKMGGLGNIGKSLDDVLHDLEQDADEDPRRLKAVK